jgi:uncharacterized Tic20 family protein
MTQYSQDPDQVRGGGALSARDERQWSVLAHLGGVLSYWPVIGVLPSLVIWAIYGKRGAYVSDQSREALNFQITVLIAWVVANGIGRIPIVPNLTILVWAFSLIFSIVAAISANRGEWYRYPLTFRFIH